jgi:hypothetical protein
LRQKKRRLGRRLIPRGDLFLQAPACEALIKTIYSPASIQDFLLSGEEGMALTADIQQNVFTDRRACLDFVATAAASRDFLVTGVNVGFHVRIPCNPPDGGALKKEDEGYQKPTVYQGPSSIGIPNY